MTIKNLGAKKEKYEARYVGQGFNEKLKDFAIHKCPILRQSSTRLIVSVSAIEQYRAALLDFMQGYLQAKERLTCQIYLEHRYEDLHFCNIGTDKILELLKPLYGTWNSGNYWGSTFAEYVKKSLRWCHWIATRHLT